MFAKIKYYIYIYSVNTILIKLWIAIIIIKNNGFGIFSKKKKICIIYEPRFRYIIDELINSGYSVIFVPRQIFEYSFLYRLKPYLINSRDTKLGEYCLTYYSEYKNEINNYKKDLVKISNDLKSFINSDKIILTKINDDWTIQLVTVLTDTGWQTIVYDREGTVTPKRLEYVPEILSKFDIRCSAVITYNDIHSEFFQKVKEYGHMQGDIIVNGNPLSDYWFQNDIEKETIIEGKNRGKTFLYFSFGPKNYVNYYYDNDPESATYNWTPMLSEIHNIFHEHFLNSNDVLIYKIGHKSHRDYFSEVNKLKKIENVKILDDKYDTYKLISEADAIIGFQTTGLIEAMYTDKPIIYCGWGETYEKIKDTLIDYHILGQKRGIMHAKDKFEFKELLNSKIDTFSHDKKERKKFRYKYMHNENGDVAKNFIKIVKEYAEFN
jgi:hypothetical protein